MCVPEKSVGFWRVLLNTLLFHVAAQLPMDAYCGGTAAVGMQDFAFGTAVRAVGYAQRGLIAVAQLVVERYVEPPHGVAVVVGERPVVEHACEVAHGVDMTVEVDVGVAEANGLGRGFGA